MAISLRDLVMQGRKIADARAKECRVDVLVDGRWKHYATENSPESAVLTARNVRQNFCSGN